MLVLLIGSEICQVHEKWASCGNLPSQQVVDCKSTRSFPILPVDPSTITNEQCESIAKQVQHLIETLLMRRHYGPGIPDWTFILSSQIVRTIIDAEHLCLFIAVDCPPSNDDATSSSTPTSIASTMPSSDVFSSISPSSSLERLTDQSNSPSTSPHYSLNDKDNNNNQSSSTFVSSSFSFIQNLSQRLRDTVTGTMKSLTHVPISWVRQMETALTTTANTYFSKIVQKANLLPSTLTTSTRAVMRAILPSLDLPRSLSGASFSSPPSSLLPCPEFILVDGNVKGCLMASTYPALAGIRGRLEDLVVDPTAKGQTFGKRLVGAAFDFCQQRQCVDVQLTSAAGRVGARHIYHELGMRTRSTFVYTKFLDSDQNQEEKEQSEKQLS